MENSRQALDSNIQGVQTGGSSQVPACDVASMPGFRFQPTEEELVGFYLRSMVTGNRLEVELINVLNLYHYDPWELPAMAFMQGEREWLFFCPRDKKYPNGSRPNRVTASGYWKATGTDRPVRRVHDSRCIGLKKTLVFYTGKAPRGRKTEWIMNEYRLPQSEQSCSQALQNLHLKSSMSEDRREVALCRIYKKPVQSNHCTADHLFVDFTTEDTLQSLESSSLLKSSWRKDQVAVDQIEKFIFHDTASNGMASGSTSGIFSASKSYPTSSVSMDPRKCSFMDEIDTVCTDTGSTINFTEQVMITPRLQRASSCGRNFKLETDPSLMLQSSLRAQLNIEAKSAPLPGRSSVFLNAPAPRFSDTCGSHQVFNSGAQSSQLIDGLTWFEAQEHLARVAMPGASRQPSFSNLTTISSIDRLLKSSMWSPLPRPQVPASTDDGDHLHESAAPFFSSQFVWNSQPPWFNSTATTRRSLLQMQEQSHSTL